MDDLRKAISDEINTLSFGYEYQMSDYAGSREQEREYEREGKAAVKRIEKKIAEIACRFAESQVRELSSFVQTRGNELYTEYCKVGQLGENFNDKAGVAINDLFIEVEEKRNQIINQLTEGL